jgi:hypothetical protein
MMIATLATSQKPYKKIKNKKKKKPCSTRLGPSKWWGEGHGAAAAFP